MPLVRYAAVFWLVIATTLNVRADDIVLLCASPLANDTQIVSVDTNTNEITVKRDQAIDEYVTRAYRENETNSDIRVTQKVAVNANTISYEDRFLRPDNSVAITSSHIIDRKTNILTVRRSWQGGEASLVYRCQKWRNPR